MIIAFWIEDGKLFGAPEGEDPGEIVHVKLEELQFEVETPDGQYFDIEFVRDDKGKITKMVLGAGEMEIEAKRLEEKKEEKEKK